MDRSNTGEAKVSDKGAFDLSFGLGGKTAVVTGGASGIGAAIASTFVAKGARVGIVDVNSEGAMKMAEALGPACAAFACNVSAQQSVTACVDEVISRFGRVDVLVNNAGVVMLGSAEELGVEAWEATMSVNLLGTFLMSQAVGRHMLEAGKGKIINIASQAASVALRGHAAYCASKAGVLGLTRVLAYEWAGRGVNVNAISPTVVMTDLGRKAWEGPRGEEMKALIPTGRFAEPEEIAAAALFLASAASDMINGADLLVDGGYTIQ
ncbi:MAG TPA: D-threitol dehydrogenase [Acidimicrobiales bacterium]|nr:D-threitol dehydrogenase [Acidimicrobiales bacterium]